MNSSWKILVAAFLSVVSFIDNEEISQFGVLQVIASKMAAFFHTSNGKDTLRSITTAQRRFVFLEKGPLIMVCIIMSQESESLSCFFYNVFLQLVCLYHLHS